MTHGTAESSDQDKSYFTQGCLIGRYGLRELDLRKNWRLLNEARFSLRSYASKAEVVCGEFSRTGGTNVHRVEVVTESKIGV